MGKGLVSLELPSGDIEQYILYEGINSNDILSIIANSEYPNQLIKDMGTRVDDAEFAEMEQSKECMFSIDYTMGDSSARLYEINGGRGGISEGERTDDNISFNRVDISNYKVVHEKEEHLEHKKDIVKLTGQPVSDEMEDVLERCDKGEYVPIEEIQSTLEMITAASCVSHQTPTINLQGRESIQDRIFDILSDYGSVLTDENGKPVVDKDGNTVYNDIVEQGSRLDIVIGLPASGKSSAIVDTISKEHHSMLIDNDEAKRMFPEFNQGWGAGVVHLESQKVEQKVFRNALFEKKNIVLPKVGSYSKWILDDYIIPAKRLGYKVNVHFVDLDRNKAMGRLLHRFISTGRFLNPSIIDGYANEREGNLVEKSFEELKNSNMVDGTSKWNNDVGRNERPILLEAQGLDDVFIKEAVNRANGGNEYDRDNEKSDTKQRSDGGEIQESSAGDSGKLCISGNDRENGRSNAQSFIRNERENGRTGKNASKREKQTDGRNNEQISLSSGKSGAVEPSKRTLMSRKMLNETAKNIAKSEQSKPKDLSKEKKRNEEARD